MIINNQILGNAILENIKQPIKISNIACILKREFNINGLNEVLLYDITSVIKETNAVKRMYKEDIVFSQKNKLEGMFNFWEGEKNLGIPTLNMDSIVAIGDLGFDLPICLDFSLDKRNPSVIFLDIKVWVKIAENYSEFMKKLGR